MKNLKVYSTFLIGLYACHVCSEGVATPNIVIMLADDLGYGDVSSFGNKTLPTQHIDQMMREGVTLTHHLATDSVCTPSRAALLTGRYPIRAGMVPNSIFKVNVFVASRAGMLPSETTVAKLAKSVGYKTAMIGKWHLGLSKDTYGDHLLHPMNHGFDQYYGHILTNLKDFSGEGDRVLLSLRSDTYYIIASLVTLGILVFVWLHRQRYIDRIFMVIGFVIVLFPAIYIVFVFSNLEVLNSILMRDHEVVEQPIRLHSLMKRYVQEGIEFLEARERDKSPFLLFLSWDHVHTALKTAKEFRGRSQHGRYGDAVLELDWGTGEIMSTIKGMDIGSNTLVYFTSDNGAHLEETGIHGERDGGSNGILKGGKSHGATDGGIRVPGSVWFPRKIPSNVVIDEPTSHMDMFTTIVKLIGAEVPTDRPLDGQDIYSLLTGQDQITPHEFFFHYCGSSLQAVRYRPRTGSAVWKLVYEIPGYLPGLQRCTYVCHCSDAIRLEQPLLYDITSDPGETRPINIASETKYQNIVEVMNHASRRHTESIETVECRLSFFKLLWRPYMQPCCNFPYCSCVDEKYSHLD